MFKNSIAREYCFFVSFLCVGQFWQQALTSWLSLVKGSSDSEHAAEYFNFNSEECRL